MMSKLRVRVYDVKFGDAILITIPKGAKDVRHVLIDVGNAPFKEGSDKSVYLPIIEDVLAELNGKPLHLYISTHEHMDHVQGLFHASRDLAQENRDLAKELKAKRVWLTASADPDYYNRHPDARRKKAFHEALYLRIAEAEKRLGRPMLPAAFEAMAANNHPRSTTACVDYVRDLGGKNVRYLHRGADANLAHKLPDVEIRVLAPEEDTSVYYGRRGMAADALWLDDAKSQSLLELAGEPERQLPSAPQGVDATSFRTLWEVFRDGPLTDALLQIDKAANNTSLVLELTWHRWKLLFTGDAEERSWEEMSAQGVLQPVHFLKVSHHGSHNGTPSENILDAVLPIVDGVDRIAVVSTCANTYSGIPHKPTDTAIKRRCKTFRKTTERMLDTTESGARYIDFEFDSSGPP